MSHSLRTALLPLICFTWLLTFVGCSAIKKVTEPDADITSSTPVDTTEESGLGAKLREHTADYGNLWDEIIEGYEFPDVSDAKIDKRLDWLSNNPRHLSKVTAQSEPYLYYVANELRKHDLPMELALLPIIESAYNPFAVSRSNALGVWQLMPNTGRNLGLEQNHWYDGRRDIVASTDAVVRYLKRLNAMFDGDWLLTMAAYNAGEGTVRRAIAKNRKLGKDTDFWSLSLPKQTTYFVPRLIALSKIIAEPEKYDVELKEIENTPYFTTVNVDTPIDLAQAARIADIDPQELRKLNAGYNKWITDPSGPHQLLVPIDDAAQFTLSLDKLPPIGPIQTEQHYKVKSGDTLGAIAKRFGTSVKAIQSANKLQSTQLKIGQNLAIPGQMLLNSPYATQAKQEAVGNHKKPAAYTVKSGDSFWTIAKKHRTSVSNLLKWNDLSANSTLKPGQKLLIADKN